jgi:hypothetical protein
MADMLPGSTLTMGDPKAILWVSAVVTGGGLLKEYVVVVSGCGGGLRCGRFRQSDRLPYSEGQRLTRLIDMLD